MESEYINRTGQLIEYMKLHLISLMQDMEALEEQMEQLDMNSKDFMELDFEFNNLSGQTIATRHLMSVASDILGIQIEEK
jgi:hypothetical protein